MAWPNYTPLGSPVGTKSAQQLLTEIVNLAQPKLNQGPDWRRVYAHAILCRDNCAHGLHRDYVYSPEDENDLAIAHGHILAAHGHVTGNDATSAVNEVDHGGGGGGAGDDGGGTGGAATDDRLADIARAFRRLRDPKFAKLLQEILLRRPPPPVPPKPPRGRGPIG